MRVFDLIANFASILGLIISLVAMVKARRAVDAADQARIGVLVRALTDEIELACVKMEQLRDFIDHNRLAEAAIRARELTLTLSEIPFRRAIFLDDSRKAKMLNVREQLHIVDQELTKSKRAPLTLKRKQDVAEVCTRALMTLRENLSTIKAQLDMGGK